jgi:CubicO group peptidase (beta-lactamase class C family)
VSCDAMMRMRSTRHNCTRGSVCVALLWACAVTAHASPVTSTVASFSREMADQLHAYTVELMARTGVPGVAIGIVQGDSLVYAEGLGVRERGRPARVTPETLMMTGSTGKSMTTMMMAALVDEGTIRWDTPVVAIYPKFAVRDPVLTAKISFRNTVCNCTGIERHDLEMEFASRPKTPEAVIASLGNFALTGTFGKTFGYVNQMVAAGGYIAAWSAARAPTSLYENYLSQMERLVFRPVGMASTTFSFEQAKAAVNHATPHGQIASGGYVPISTKVEETLKPFAPAGAAWSNVLDLSGYLITELNRGVAPGGTRVVSAENLQETWRPQVGIQPGAQYGLGWMIVDYQGNRVLAHGGGTAGFTSELSFLPDDGLGIVVLTNAQNASLFVGALRTRVLELVFGQPMTLDYSQKIDQTKSALQGKTALLKPSEMRGVAAYSGRYVNRDLGEVEVKVERGKLLLTTPDFATELRPVGGMRYLFWNPPLAGVFVEFSRTEDGDRAFLLDPDSPDAPQKYTFTYLRQSTAGPSARKAR